MNEYTDYKAIVEAYKNSERPVVSIDTTEGAFDKDGNKVEVDFSLVKEARVKLDAEYAKVKYKDQRMAEYPDWTIQLDYIYHNGIDKWKTDIVDPVKKKYPKPE